MPVRVSVSEPAPVPGVAARAIVERAVRAALADAEVDDGELSVTLLEDEAMEALNRRWRQQDGTTDVLAFALHAEGEPMVGDVYVGADRARSQALEHGEPLERELARLAVHGTLHVLGWDHPAEDREESEMWRTQERIVEGLEGT